MCLDKSTRDGHRELAILTNLPEAISALQIAGLYRKRWGIERMFQELERALDGEIDTLGYPKAALFSFCLALCAYNVYATIKAALRSVHGEEVVRDEVSDYRIATEVAAVYAGIELVTEPEDWCPFREMTSAEFATWLAGTARYAKLSQIRKAKRGPKKPAKKRKFDPAHPHVSTARILAKRRVKNARS